MKKKETPKNIHYKHGAYYYVKKRAGKVTWKRLGKTEPEMYLRLAEIKADSFNSNTMSEYFCKYEKEILPTKAETTQKYYSAQIKNLNKVFGHMRPNGITTTMIYKFMDLRAKTSKIQANREQALLSTVFRYCIRWGVIRFNPCSKIEKFQEKTRDRYVEDKEYNDLHKFAKPLIQVVMEIAVITGMRQRDILNLRLLDLKNDGIHITTGKTGTKQIILWTPDLKTAIQQAKNLRKVTSSIYLISNLKGKPYTSSGFKSMWQKTMNKALEKGVIKERFTFRDLRPKAASDHVDGTKLLAHADPKTTIKYYERKPKEVTPSR